MFTTGFAMDAGASALPERKVINWLLGWAIKTNAAIAGSVALQTDKAAVNRFLLVEPGGTVHAYDKRHLFRMAERFALFSLFKPQIIRVVLNPVKLTYSEHDGGSRMLPNYLQDLDNPLYLVTKESAQ